MVRYFIENKIRDWWHKRVKLKELKVIFEEYCNRDKSNLKVEKIIIRDTEYKLHRTFGITHYSIKYSQMYELINVEKDRTVLRKGFYTTREVNLGNFINVNQCFKGNI